MLLSLEHVHKTYHNNGRVIHALHDVTLHVAQGQFLAIRGASGCGKTTLLLTAGGLLAPQQGRVRLAGQDLYQLGPEARARLRAQTVGFVFQQFHLLPYLSVRDNVLAPALAGTSDTQALQRRADELLEHLGLGPRAAHLPGQLSTGERQRTALARALVAGPKLVLADEPTGNLDPDSARAVLDELAAFAHSGGAVLLVTHDPAAAARAQACCEMRDGRLSIPAAWSVPAGESAA